MVAAAARLVFAECPRGGRGGGATRLRGMPASRPRRRRDESAESPRGEGVRVRARERSQVVGPAQPEQLEVDLPAVAGLEAEGLDRRGDGVRAGVAEPGAHDDGLRRALPVRALELLREPREVRLREDGFAFGRYRDPEPRVLARVLARDAGRRERGGGDDAYDAVHRFVARAARATSQQRVSWFLESLATNAARLEAPRPAVPRPTR